MGRGRCYDFLKNNALILAVLVGVAVGFGLGFGIRATSPSDEAIMWLGKPPVIKELSFCLNHVNSVSLLCKCK